MRSTYDRARTFLLYGFAISLIVHLVLLPFVRTLPTRAQDEQPPVLRFEPMPTAPPLPSPSPRPTLTPSPAPASPRPPAHRRLRVTPPQQHSHAGGVRENGASQRAGTAGDSPEASSTGAPVAGAAAAEAPTPSSSATPAPPPTPTPLSCARPNVRATTIRALEPETPALAMQQGISGTVDVVVSLDAQSRVVATRIANSPSPVLNAAAVAAARGSQFRTEIKDCEPVSADYIFRVDFTAQ